MKQNDLVVLIVVSAVSIVVSVFAAKFIFPAPNGKGDQVDVVPSISTSFPTPSSHYFNSQSIDPLQYINIQNNNDTTPFNTPSQ